MPAMPDRVLPIGKWWRACGLAVRDDRADIAALERWSS